MFVCGLQFGFFFLSGFFKDKKLFSERFGVIFEESFLGLTDCNGPPELLNLFHIPVMGVSDLGLGFFNQLSFEEELALKA